jgi:hypothetical protein
MFDPLQVTTVGSEGRMAADKNSATKSAEYCHQFLNRYLERGFGTLSKREIDRLVFALLVDTKRVADLEDHFAASRQLKVTPAKAANLAYEYKLHRQPNLGADELRQRFGELLRNTNLGKAQHKVALEVRDRVLREEVEQEILRLKLAAPDYSFNRNLLLLDFQTFSALVSAFAGEAAMKRIEAELKKHKELPQGLPSPQALLTKLLEHAAGRAGDELSTRLFDLAEIVLTGGIPSIIRKTLG